MTATQPPVDSFVRLALLAAMECGEATPEEIAGWAREVLPPAVLDRLSPGELRRRAALLLAEPRH
jgi:hypothetical protein